ncbi:MAG: hypothetical protein DRP56_11020 [Planctomycetota bacterium]|nr:MAG: hypothetical protein DRP56_11020 [Planctomycetota bacterium]
MPVGYRQKPEMGLFRNFRFLAQNCGFTLNPKWVRLVKRHSAVRFDRLTRIFLTTKYTKSTKKRKDGNRGFHGFSQIFKEKRQRKGRKRSKSCPFTFFSITLC